MAKRFILPKHEEWLSIAEHDLIAAKRLIKDDDCTLAPAIFHTQQCAEKAFKAYLAYKKQKHQRTHDLVDLVKLCSKFDHDFYDILDLAMDLNPHLTTSRYPDDCLVIPCRSEVENAIKHATTIYNLVISKII